MYMHPSSVPIDCAKALHRILHNSARAADWETLDAWARQVGIDIVISLVMETLEMNGMKAGDQERAWWLRELRKID